MEPILLIYLGVLTVLGLGATRTICNNQSSIDSPNFEKKI